MISQLSRSCLFAGLLSMAFVAAGRADNPKQEAKPAKAERTDSGPTIGGRNFYDQFIRRYDKNEDGKLTLEEVPEEDRSKMEPIFEQAGKKEITVDDVQKVFAEKRRSSRSSISESLFKRLDTNGDGKVTSAEAPERYKRLVIELTRQLGKKEGDSLTLDEFQQAGRPQPPPDPRPERPEFALVRVLDTDGDGKLTKEEIAAAAEKFETLDLNRDGKLDAFELTAPERRNRQPVNRPRANLSPVDRMVDLYFNRYDTDKDGVIALEELSPTRRRMYAEWDSDKDEELTKEELRKGLKERYERFNLDRGRRATDN